MNYKPVFLLRFMRVSVLGDSGAKGSLPSKDTLLALVDTFVLCERENSHKSGGWGAKFDSGPRVNPIEEMQLLMSVRTQLEEQQSLELRYCTFDAMFGSIAGSSSGQVSEGTLHGSTPPDTPYRTLWWWSVNSSART